MLDTSKEKRNSKIIIAIGFILLGISSCVLLFAHTTDTFYVTLEANDAEWGYRIQSNNGIIIDFNIHIDPSYDIVAILAPFDSNAMYGNRLDWSYFTRPLYENYYQRQQTDDNINFTFNEFFPIGKSPGIGQDIVLIIQNKGGINNRITIEIFVKKVDYIFIFNLLPLMGAAALTIGIIKLRNEWNTINPVVRDFCISKFQLDPPKKDQNPDYFAYVLKPAFELVYQYFFDDKTVQYSKENLNLVFSYEKFLTKFQENEREFFKSIISEVIYSLKEPRHLPIINNKMEAFNLLHFTSLIVDKLGIGDSITKTPNDEQNLVKVIFEEDEPEQEHLDFKWKLTIDTEEAKAEFITDCLSLINTLPKGNFNNVSYYCIGFGEKDGRWDGSCCPLANLETLEKEIRQLIDNYVIPRVVVEFYRITYSKFPIFLARQSDPKIKDNDEGLIVTLRRLPKIEYELSKDFGTLKKGLSWYRSGSHKCAITLDIRTMLRNN